MLHAWPSPCYLLMTANLCMHAISDSCCSNQLQQDLDALALWCSTWKLSLNTIKCAAMWFSHSNSWTCAKYFINGEPIKCVENHKDLAILVTKNTTWSKQINFTSWSAYQSLYLICPFISFCSPNVRKQLYICLVHSRLTNCSQIWRPHLIKDTICLEKVQRRATKYIPNIFSIDCKARLKPLQLHSHWCIG